MEAWQRVEKCHNSAIKTFPRIVARRRLFALSSSCSRAVFKINAEVQFSNENSGHD